MLIDKVRCDFLNYFSSNNHVVLPSGPLILDNSNDLLFTNSGMVQFKDIFLGKKTSMYKRVATIQLCLRAGGKHNDLENVGFTTRHHTLFEMLGNFSFSDYFKEEAILFSWNFLTDILVISKNNLCVSVFKNDFISADIWRKVVGLNSNQIILKGEKDNFWSVSNVGLCGPCTEIYYDRGSAFSQKDRFIEIWNIVFLEYNKINNNTFIKLNKPFVDTGMGLERVVSVLNGSFDNYCISVFQNIINFLDCISLNINCVNSKRVIADHIRSCVFLIFYGLVPGNSGHSYVLRRILRRAFFHGMQLGIVGCFLYKLVPIVIDSMGLFYHELSNYTQLIQNVIKTEEEKFFTTLLNGLCILEKYTAKGFYDTIKSNVLFKLSDTFGLPLSFVLDVLKDRSIFLNIDGFKSLIKK